MIRICINLLIFKQFYDLHVIWFASHFQGSHASRDAFDVFTTEAFFVPIKKESFGRAFDADDEIDFIASIAGMPDLPKWMNCRHVNGSHEAYLYGTPSVNDDGDIEIEIIAMNKYNYNTFQDNLKFRITARESMQI